VVEFLYHNQQGKLIAKITIDEKEYETDDIHGEAKA
jgi:hypothetical protein